MFTPRLMDSLVGLLVMCAGASAQAQMLSIDKGKSDNTLSTRPSDPATQTTTEPGPQ